MNLIIVNANTSEEMYFVLNNNHRFSQIPVLSEEIIKLVKHVHTTSDIVEYAKSVYPLSSIVLFEKTAISFKKSGSISQEKDVIIYVEYGMIGHIINWLTKMIPFNQEICRA